MRRALLVTLLLLIGAAVWYVTEMPHLTTPFLTVALGLLVVPFLGAKPKLKIVYRNAKDAYKPSDDPITAAVVWDGARRQILLRVYVVNEGKGEAISLGAEFDSMGSTDFRDGLGKGPHSPRTEGLQAQSKAR